MVERALIGKACVFCGKRLERVAFLDHYVALLQPDRTTVEWPQIPAERLVISTDCGMGREGMSRRHAFYKIVALVQGTNIVRKELGLPVAECLVADPSHSLVVPAK